MRAAIWTAYGPPEVLQTADIERPECGPGDLLVRVEATTVTAGDTEIRAMSGLGLVTTPLRLFMGVRSPGRRKILGQELAGEIVEMGDQVEGFDVGQRIAAHAGFRFGGYAEYASISSNGLVARIPDGVAVPTAAPLPTAGIYALSFVRESNLQAAQHVLVVGGAGSIGSFAIQLAKAAGAHVTAVDHSEKTAHLRAMGADDIIAFDRQDFTTLSSTFDRILDVVDKSSFPSAAATLAPRGVYLHTEMSPIAGLRRLVQRPGEGRESRFVRGSEDRSDLEMLLGMVADGRLEVPIDSTYPLGEIVAAHLRAESGSKAGNIIVLPSER